MPRLDAATTADWADFIAELDHWAESGRTAALWWRDDDATAATPKLGNLLQLTGEVPVALAVIPALAQEDLAGALHDAPAVFVLQHGWQHANRATEGRKSEYPAERQCGAVAAELTKGRCRLTELFGPRALPVFVPPWNRFTPALLPLLVENGIDAVSAMASRHPVPVPPGLKSLDVHVDVTDWRGDRGFVGAPAVLGGLVRRLRADRLGAEPACGPAGILTHHLIMDDATASFLARLAAVVDAHDGARWASVAEYLQ